MILLYSPVLPPGSGGVADHVLACARELHDRGVAVTVAGRGGDPSRFGPVPCRVGVEPGGRGPHSLCGAAAASGAHWVVLHYVPFLYARRGLAPSLVLAAGDLRRGGVRVALLVHEPYVPFTRLPWWFTGPAMRAQLWALARRSDRIYTPVGAWASRLRGWARRETPVAVIPIGSTVPLSPLDRREARQRLGLGEGEVGVGVFSPGASGFLTSWILEARRAMADLDAVRWFLLGKGSEALSRQCGRRDAVRDLGMLEASRVGDAVRGLDLLLAPYRDGLTLRRTAAWVGPQHGVMTLSTRGPLFEESLTPHPLCTGDGSRAGDAPGYAAAARRLVLDPRERERRAAAAATFHAREASLEVLAERLSRELAP